MKAAAKSHATTSGIINREVSQILHTAPLRIETGRYEMIPYEERYCFNCTNKIESEEHVLLECPLYNDIRLELLSKIDLQHFDSLDNHEKVCHLLSDDRIAIYSAKACQIILTERRNFCTDSSYM